MIQPSVNKSSVNDLLRVTRKFIKTGDNDYIRTRIAFAQTLAEV